MDTRAEIERRRIEAALRESEEKYRRLFENSVVGFFQSTPEGRFHSVNPAFARMLGFSSPQDLVNGISDIARQYYVDPLDRQRYQKILQQRGYVENCEFRVRRKDGSQMWVSNSARAYFDPDGKVDCYEGVLIDITERKQAEKKLNEINAELIERTKLAEQRAVSIQQLAMELTNAEDRERRRLAGVLHDDFQQTLACLKLKLNSLKTSDEPDEDMAALNDIIDGCIHRCRHLVYELRPPVLLQNGFAGALRQLCRQMKDMYHLDVNLKTSSITEIKSPVLSSMLIRSIRELLINVAKHSGKKRAMVETRLDGNHIRITVKDAGRGCDPGVLYGKRVDNAGFGLFSIEDRVNFLGGYMQVDSEAGNGFSVTLWVPGEASHPSAPPELIADAKPPVESGPAEGDVVTAAAAAAGPPISVLLADDHELMREGLLKLLQGQNDINVVGVAADGREAVRLAAQLKPKVVLMDVSMPVMDGIEATAHISKLLPAARIIGLTMHQDPAIRQAMLNAGACVCLSKSGSPEELVKNMRSAHPSSNKGG
jgi:PAS domain S-box-containing protein